MNSPRCPLVPAVFFHTNVHAVKISINLIDTDKGEAPWKKLS